MSPSTVATLLLLATLAVLLVALCKTIRFYRETKKSTSALLKRLDHDLPKDST